MIITKTPFRVSFFGGGTDMPEFFKDHGGSVLSTTIDKYCYVIARQLPPFFDYASEFAYSEIERVSRICDIRHPAIREAARLHGMRDIRLSYEADLPARTGLGTSSSFAVGMLSAFHCMKGRRAGKKELADEAIVLERDLCGEAGGWQDQVAVAFGGLNRIDFSGNEYDVKPVVASRERRRRLASRLMMFFTGFSRISADVQKSSLESMAGNISKLKEMLSLVDSAVSILEDCGADLDDFGILMDETWRLKRGTGSKVSSGKIDALYERGIRAGALGGKLLGAGGGGFLLFYVPEGKRESVAGELKELMLVPFDFENFGTQVIYYTPE